MAAKEADAGRRRFLKGLAAAGGLAALGGIGVVTGSVITGSSRNRTVVSAEALDRDTFLPIVGEVVETAGENAGVQLRVTRVTPLRHYRSERGEVSGQSFSVLMTGARDDPLDQGTYRLYQKGVGTFPLFLVPVDLSGPTQAYEAVFNRIA